MADTKRYSEDNGDRIIAFGLTFSIPGVLFGFILGSQISPFTALVISCLIGPLLGWWLRYESNLLEDDE